MRILWLGPALLALGCSNDTDTSMAPIDLSVDAHLADAGDMQTGDDRGTFTLDMRVPDPSDMQLSDGAVTDMIQTDMAPLDMADMAPLDMADMAPPPPPPVCDIAPRIVDDALLGPARDLGAVPPVGQHPRVFFDAAGFAAMLDRLRTTTFGAAYVQWSRNIAQNPAVLALSDLPAGDLPPETVANHWPSDESTSGAFYVHAIHALLSEDPDQIARAAQIVGNWGRVVLAHRAQNPQDRDWSDPAWGLANGWRSGGAGFALAYDVLHPHMTPEQRNWARQAIAASTAGKRSWGMDFSPHRAFSNWYVYHGHLVVMALAIEGEEGFDAEVVDLWHRVARDWLDHSIYPSGASFEDGYSVGLALREGSSAMVALSRRGENLFEHPHYRALLAHTAQMTDPYRYGLYRGHGSGDEAGYPAFYTVARYAYPDGPLTNALWRSRMGEDYLGDGAVRVLYGQTIIETLSFGGDWLPDAATHPMDLGLPLVDCAPRRGLVVARSDAGRDALKLHFDARPDAMWPGHDNADRGGIILAALGRNWLVDDNWRSFGASTDHSVMHVDGQGFSSKPPSVRLLGVQDTDDLMVTAADLTYAWRWQWTPPWPRPDTAMMAPWTPEMSDPRALGYPGDEAWLPPSLYGHADFGFEGLWFGKQPHLPIRHAFRTIALSRTAQPFALVVDDMAHEDDAAHTWSWYAHIAPDLQRIDTGNDDVILAPNDPEDDRRLLIRMVRHGGDALRIRHETYRDARDREDAARVIIETDATEPRFVALLMPFRAGAALPQTQWNGDVLQIGDVQLRVLADDTGRHDISLP